jgi:N6-adenosine-specific RNA methylase IME4
VRSDKGHNRSPEKHYDTMTLEEIAALPVVDCVDDDAFLFFWVTGPHIAIGSHLPIMRAWGFEPSAAWGVWIKPNSKRFKQGWMFFDDFAFFVGMGYTTRQNAEFVVLGKRGKPQRLSKSVRQVLASPRREHSRKPDEFFERVEQFCEGPRLELFARESREGWTCRGNEVGKFGVGDGQDSEVRSRGDQARTA